MQGVPRNHHYVPKLHLRRFADVDGRIVVVDRRNIGRSFTRSITGVAAQKWFYSIDLGDGRRSQDYEKGLSLIESEIASVIQKILKGATLPKADSEDRSVLFGHVALQFLRTPLVRSLNRRIGELLVAELDDADAIEQIRASVEERVGLDPGESLVAQAWHQERQRLADRFARGNSNDHLAFIATSLADVSRRLMEYSALLLVWNRRKIFTSDSPVSLWSDRKGVDEISIGLLTAENIVVPLSRQAALVLVRPDLHSDDGRTIAGSTRDARFVRSVVAMNCDRWIFHHPDDGPLDKNLPLPSERIRRLSEITASAP